ncbi:MAG: hypothetical protein EZS28_049016, partial [Streblomastix strix]
MEQLDKIEPNTATRIQLVDCQNSRQPSLMLLNSKRVVYERNRRLGRWIGCITAFQQQIGNDGMGSIENIVPDKLQPMRTDCYPSNIEIILTDYIAHENRRNKDQIIQLNQVSDSLSRSARSSDYSVRRDVLQKPLDQLEIKLSMDAFATRLNRQHRVFCSYKLDFLNHQFENKVSDYQILAPKGALAVLLGFIVYEEQQIHSSLVIQFIRPVVMRTRKKEKQEEIWQLSQLLLQIES